VVAVDENGQVFVVTARGMADAEKKTFRGKAWLARRRYSLVWEGSIARHSICCI
jgi:hypothetical protein